MIAPFFALLLAATPLAAQDNETTPDDDGFSLMEEGAKMLLRGLMQEMEPAIDDLQDLGDEMGEAMQLLADQMGPAMAGILSKIDDLRYYEPPEITPEGNIILRRRDTAPAYEPDPDPVTGEITL